MIKLSKNLKHGKKAFLKIEKPKIPDFPTIVKDSFKEKFNNLWVHNFPWSKIEVLLKNHEKKDQDIVHDLELFGVVNTHSKDLEKEIKENFLKSKIFNWLITRLKKG